MISNPLYLISLLVGSWLAFFTAAAVIDTAIFIFGIKNRRLRSCLRFIPFINLPADLFFNWFNPLSCGSCLQNLILQISPPQLKEYLNANEISLMNYLAPEYAAPLFTALFFLLCLATVFFVVQTTYRAIRSIRSCRVLKENSRIFKQKIISRRLESTLKRRRVRIYVSAAVASPTAAPFSSLFLPESVVRMASQQEIEAIIAHELEHILWLDPISRIIIHIIASIFWWVPVKSWMEKFEQEQEMACDCSIRKYGFDAETLASALLNAAKQAKAFPSAILCRLSGKRHLVVARIRELLGYQLNTKEKLKISALLIAGMGFFLMIFCLL